MTEYRTPSENEAQQEHETRVRAVLDHAIRDGASLVAAMQLDEAPEVVERWVDTFHDGLRDNLSDDGPDVAGLRLEDRIAAIVLLLEPQIEAAARELLAEVRNVGGGDR